jgi:hypothetical protein
LYLSGLSRRRKSPLSIGLWLENFIGSRENFPLTLAITKSFLYAHSRKKTCSNYQEERKMAKSSIPADKAHLYTTPVESGLIWAGAIGIVLALFYLGISLAERSLTFAMPILGIALAFGAVATVLYYLARAQAMHLQPGNPKYVGPPEPVSK